MSQTDPYFLSHGPHRTPEQGRCAMEWVSYLAGEPHSDHPVCVSPVLRGFGIRLNDVLSDDDRQRLRPYLARCIGTASDGRDPERLQILTEFVLRRSLPRSLDELGLQAAAARVRELPLDLTLEHVRETLVEIRQEARRMRDQKVGELRAKVRKRWSDASAAAADASAADDVYTAAAAAAAAADVYAAIAADAAADVYAAAYAYAYADAAAAAAAAAYADAASAAHPSATYDTVYAKAKTAALNALSPRRERALREVLELFDRMLPKEVIQLPVVEDAQAVCALP